VFVCCLSKLPYYVSNEALFTAIVRMSFVLVAFLSEADTSTTVKNMHQ